MLGHSSNKSGKLRKRGIGLLLCIVLAGMLAFVGSGVLLATEDPHSDSAASQAAVVDPVSQSENCLAVLYDATNGFPTSEANDIAQTKEGFLWIGTYGGLIRYDGNTFEQIGRSVNIASVRSLLVDRHNRLWIGTNDNGLALLEKGSFQRWTVEDGLPGAAVRSILQDGYGSVYVGTAGGLAIIDEDMELQRVEDERVKQAFILELRLGADGLVYGVTNDGQAFVMDRGKVVEFYEPAYFDGMRVDCIFPDPEKPGDVYIDTSTDKIFRGRLADGFGSMKEVESGSLEQIQRIDYIDGKVWLCALNGVGVVDGDGFHLLENLPMNNSIGHVMADSTGNLWFTSTRQGVMKVVPNRFVSITDRFGLPETVVNSTCKLGDRLFMATDDGLRVLNENEGTIDSIPLDSAKTASGEDLGSTDLIELLGDIRIRSILRDSKGRLWFATWRNYGMLCYDPNEGQGSVTAYTPADGLLSDHVRAGVEREDGSILVAVSGGVNVIRDGRVAESYGAADGIENTETLTVAEGFDNEIVVGSDGRGIYILDGSDTRHIGRDEGLTSEAILRIRRDDERGIYWIVTGNSLCYMDKDFKLTTIENFPYTNNFDLRENANGEMWVLSSNGIYVAPTEALLSGGPIETAHYGIDDGLPSIATANSYSELTEDGDLYIAGSNGVVKVNIDKPFDDLRNLKSAIPYIEVDGERAYPDEFGTFNVPSTARKIVIHAYVYTYSLVSPQITYRLNGFDQTDTNVSRSELGPIVYTNLRGGDYRFVMEMKDSVHQQKKIVSAKIIKEKALYEQVWFYAVAALGAGALLAIGTRVYIREKVRKLDEKNREEAEKERIENELSMARRIQEDALPNEFPAFPDRSDIDIYATMEPAKEVGGDFYDFFLIDDDHLCMIMADVSGKGIPASLFMMVSMSLLRNTATSGNSPAETLRKVNETICSNNEMDMFVTVWLGILDLNTGELVAANAGHEYPMIMRHGHGFEMFKDKHGFVIGAMEGMRYKDYTISLSPGDKLFLYTDGLAEATDANEKLFGLERIVDALNVDPAAKPTRILELVHAAVDDFVKDAEQFDDLTMMCFEYLEKDPE